MSVINLSQNGAIWSREDTCSMFNCTRVRPYCNEVLQMLSPGKGFGETRVYGDTSVSSDGSELTTRIVSTCKQFAGLR